MKGLREKFRNKKGFTLVEMLIVVAIIAILVAVSIPLVGNALEKARDATDQANERAAKAAAAVVYFGIDDGSFETKDGTFWYDAPNGKLIEGDTKPTGDQAIAPYGRCTKVHNGANDSYQTDKAHTNCIIKVVIDEDGTMKITWESAT